MADITLFELHLDEASLSNTSPLFGGSDAGAVEEPDEGDGADTEGAAGKLFALLALAGIVALAWFVSRSDVAEDIDIAEEIEVTN